MTYDDWRTGGDTPLGALDMTNEYAEEDALENAHEEHMQALAVWIEHATGRQIKIGVRLMEDAIKARIADAAAEMRALGAGSELPRKPRKDKGKPRATKEAEVQP